MVGAGRFRYAGITSRFAVKCAHAHSPPRLTLRRYTEQCKYVLRYAKTLLWGCGVSLRMISGWHARGVCTWNLLRLSLSKFLSISSVPPLRGSFWGLAAIVAAKFLDARRMSVDNQRQMRGRPQIRLRHARPKQEMHTSLLTWHVTW